MELFLVGTSTKYELTDHRFLNYRRIKYVLILLLHNNTTTPDDRGQLIIKVFGSRYPDDYEVTKCGPLYLELVSASQRSEQRYLTSLVSSDF